MGLCVAAALLAPAASASAQPRLPGQGGQTTPSTPQSGVFQKVTAEQLLPIVRGLGFKAEIAQTNDATPKIVAEFWNADVYSGILLHQCDQGGCFTMRFFVNLGKDQAVDANWISAWNLGMLFSKAVTLQDQSLVFLMDVSIAGGVTEDFLKSAVRTFIANVNYAPEFKPQSQ